MSQENFPYGLVSRGNMHNRTSLMFLEACYRADDKELAAKVYASVKKDLEQQIKYYNTLDGWKADNQGEERRMAENYLKTMDEMQKSFNVTKVSSPEAGKVIDSNAKK